MERIRRQPRRDHHRCCYASYQENEETQKIQPTVEAFVSGYTEIPEGADTAQLTPQGVVAYVEKYAEVTNRRGCIRADA